MSERKPWSEDEDKVLKYLRQEMKITKWSQIARKMAEDYKIGGRNGKQCRERYQNHLDSTVKRQEWTYQQEQQLYKLHNEIGNKWALIANKMDGRTDNCVKNHFYSKLRKALRKLNKVIHDCFRKEFKELRMTVLYKIIEAADDRFKEKQTINSDLSSHSCQLKNMLLDFSNDEENQFQKDIKKVKTLIEAIYIFNNSYKRKPKKTRQNNWEDKKIINLPKIEKFKCPSDLEEQSDDYIDAEEEESFQIGQKCPQKVPQNQRSQILMPTPIRASVMGNSCQNPQQNMHLQDSMNVQYALNNAGILQDAYMLSMSDLLKRSLSFSIYSDLNRSLNLLKSESIDDEKEKKVDGNSFDDI